jgi:hypothetical protein
VPGVGISGYQFLWWIRLFGDQEQRPQHEAPATLLNSLTDAVSELSTVAGASCCCSTEPPRSTSTTSPALSAVEMEPLRVGVVSLVR